MRFLLTAKVSGSRQRSFSHCCLSKGGRDVSMFSVDVKVSEEMKTEDSGQCSQTSGPTPGLVLLLAGWASCPVTVDKYGDAQSASSSTFGDH